MCAAPLQANHLGRARPIRHPPLAALLLPHPTAVPRQAHPGTAPPQGKPRLQEAHQVNACKLISGEGSIRQQHTLSDWSSSALATSHSACKSSITKNNFTCQAGVRRQTAHVRLSMHRSQSYHVFTGATTGSPGAPPTGPGAPKASGGSPAAEAKTASSPGPPLLNAAQSGNPTGNAAQGMSIPRDASLAYRMLSSRNLCSFRRHIMAALHCGLSGLHIMIVSPNKLSVSPDATVEVVMPVAGCLLQCFLLLQS